MRKRIFRTVGRVTSLRHCRAHLGGVVAVAQGVRRRVPILSRPIRVFETAMSSYTDRRAQRFDQRYGTDTYARVWLRDLPIGRTLESEEYGSWRYGPINEDFFAEMMGRCPADLSRYTMLDVGSGKGLATMLASDYGFRRIIGVEFEPSLIDVAARNLERFNQARSRPTPVEWVCGDFMQHEPPDEPTLFFLNDPFPEDVSLRAVAHIESWLARETRDALVVYRRASRNVRAVLEASQHLRVECRTPYWIILQSR